MQMAGTRIVREFRQMHVGRRLYLEESFNVFTVFPFSSQLSQVAFGGQCRVQRLLVILVQKLYSVKRLR